MRKAAPRLSRASFTAAQEPRATNGPGNDNVFALAFGARSERCARVTAECVPVCACTVPCRRLARRSPSTFCARGRFVRRRDAHDQRLCVPQLRGRRAREARARSGASTARVCRQRSLRSSAGGRRRESRSESTELERKHRSTREPARMKTSAPKSWYARVRATRDRGDRRTHHASSCALDSSVNAIDERAIEAFPSKFGRFL